MFPFAVSRDVRPELAHLRAVIVFQAAIMRILLRLIPDALRYLTDADRRQLAELGQPLGWVIAAESTQGLVATGTLRGWYRRLVK